MINRNIHITFVVNIGKNSHPECTHNLQAVAIVYWLHRRFVVVETAFSCCGKDEGLLLSPLSSL